MGLGMMLMLRILIIEKTTQNSIDNKEDNQKNIFTVSANVEANIWVWKGNNFIMKLNPEHAEEEK